MVKNIYAIENEELPDNPGSRILDPEEEGRWGNRSVVGKIMVNVKTCATCGYQTNDRGDMSIHKKEKHS